MGIFFFIHIYIVTPTGTHSLILLSLRSSSLWNSVSLLLWLPWGRFNSHLFPKWPWCFIWKKRPITFWLWNSGMFFFPNLEECRVILLTIVTYASDVAHGLPAFKSHQSCQESTVNSFIRVFLFQYTLFMILLFNQYFQCEVPFILYGSSFCEHPPSESDAQPHLSSLS